MNCPDYYPERTKWWFAFKEKGGKRHAVSAHHNATEYMDAYLSAAGIERSDPTLKHTPLFRRLDRQRRLTDSHAQGTSSRIWLFYHASYLEAFGRAAPFRRVSEKAIERIVFILDEEIPEPFKNPEDRSSFFHHADKARKVLGWEKCDRKLRTKLQQWLNIQARRSDDSDYLRQLLEARICSERVVLPAESTLEQMVTQARSTAQKWIAASITGGLGKQQIKSVDDLWNIKEGSQALRGLH